MPNKSQTKPIFDVVHANAHHHSIHDVARMPELLANLIRSRRSVRAFLPDEPDSSEINAVLELARYAPSGSNTQPWKVHVLPKSTIDAVYEAVRKSSVTPRKKSWTDYLYFPPVLPAPYIDRRRALGQALYDLLGIGRRDLEKIHQQHLDNLRFFDAPVGILVTIDRSLERGSWVDLGIFVQTILLACSSRGLASCPQAAFAPFHEEIRTVIPMPEDQVLVCGIAIGYEDVTHPANQLRPSRAPLDEWVTWEGGMRKE